jgi:hypothetical protein
MNTRMRNLIHLNSIIQFNMDYTGRKLISSVIWVAIASMALAFSSCYPTRNVPQGDYLLVKSKYKITEEKLKPILFPAILPKNPIRKYFSIAFISMLTILVLALEIALGPIVCLHKTLGSHR